MVSVVLTLSVVVPATNRPPTVQRCLDAIRAADDGPDELVVVDRPGSLSAGGARNLGARMATGEVVVFVDADVVVHPDAFTRIRAAFADRPGLTAVFGSYDDRPEAGRTVSAFRNLLHHHVHHAGAGPARTFWTGLGAVRRADFLRAGGFDEARYPHPSIEDVELGDRLAAAGAQLELDPAIQGTHLKRWTLPSMVWTDFARRGVPWVALQLRNRRVSSHLNLGWRHRVTALTWIAIVASVVGGSLLVTAAAAALVVGLNHAFYRLLARQLGPVPALAGVALHGLHHLVSVAAVPAGIVVAARTARSAGRMTVPVGPATDGLAAS
jgi:GT2 family glycosyltransferase